MEQFNLDELIKDLSKKDSNTKASQSEPQEMNIEPEQMKQLQALCQSKAEEFALIGYDNVNQAAIWSYFVDRYGHQFPPLHKIVNEILTLKITTFMNWETLKAYKG